MDLSHLRCKRCSAPIQPKNVNTEQMFANCGICHLVFRVHPRDLTAAPPAPAFAGTTHPFPRWAVIRSPHGVVVRVGWPRAVGVLCLVFALPLGYVLWSNLARGLASPRLDLNFWIGTALFGLIWAALTYAALAAFINHTTLTATRSGLSLSRGPIPFPGGRAVARADIDQLYCEEQWHRNRKTYALKLIQRGGDTQHLWSNTLDGPDTSAAHALYLEAALEDALGIRDALVDGEYKGGTRTAKGVPAPSNAPAPSAAALARLRCRHCRAAIDPADLFTARRFALCRTCHTVFRLPDDAPTPAPTPSAPSAPAIPEIEFIPVDAPAASTSPPRQASPAEATQQRPARRHAAPDRWDVTEGRDRFEVRVRWSVAQGVIFAALSLFLGYGFWNMTPSASLAVNVFSVAVMIGIFALIAWGALQYLFNTTVIRADARGVSVAHVPLGWRHDGWISRRDIAQVYCTQHHSRNATTYSLHVLLTDGTSRPLIDSAILSRLEDALYLEEAIEARLGIQDAAVRGEVGS